MRILLVDDDPSVLLALRLVLQAYGHTVTEASNGISALEILQYEHTFKVIISDLRMDLMDGMTFLKKVKGTPLLKEIPFILMSGHATDEDIAEAKALGAAHFLPKPFHPSELHTALGIRSITDGCSSSPEEDHRR